MHAATRQNSDARLNELDPAPRKYASGVSLLRRSQFDLNLNQQCTPKDVRDWLLNTAILTKDTIDLTKEFAERLAQAGLGVRRLSLNVGTLHPQAFGYAWNWSTTDGLCDEIQIGEEALHSDGYRKNPLFNVMEYGRTVRVALENDEGEAASPLMKNLGKEGFSEYVALPMSASCGRFNAITLATRQRGGFERKQLESLTLLIKLFGLHVDRHVAERITKNISHTYLGWEAGERVASGTIKRGTGVPIRAVVWSSDMRGFSTLSENMDTQTVATVLDHYFSAMADAVNQHGGDVLKFIGDGMLAVFPIASFETPHSAAQAAIQAARQALSELDLLNERMRNEASWFPLHAGIGLHLGKVFFGNIGAAQRLDFTVIGEAVNVASRIEGCCKKLKRNLLFSSEIACLLDDEVESLGTQCLKGMNKPEQLYSLRSMV
ncbi:adenylate/guanylate cyclase domain-containing protein [Ruegeria arenilitoris]|uniref:adenylate/guanylate cyclase domain-containing protein n=1 Tax=Ruegeria arenilitoris TaxID=1173585 RepID=UPI00147C75C5|nr:adenylate/guanylate cyclase domain-containing protein [Ruegeria arenilitoris]